MKRMLLSVLCGVGLLASGALAQVEYGGPVQLDAASYPYLDLSAAQPGSSFAAPASFIKLDFDQTLGATFLQTDGVTQLTLLGNGYTTVHDVGVVPAIDDASVMWATSSATLAGGAPVSLGQAYGVYVNGTFYGAIAVVDSGESGAPWIRVEWVRDFSGNRDFTPPPPPAFEIVATAPMDGETGVPVGLATIDINVSTTVDEAASSISVSATGSLSGTVTIAGAGVAGSSQIVADVSGHPFAYGETVDVTLDGTIVNVNGDTLLVPYTFSFTIENKPPPSGIVYGSGTVSDGLPFFDLSAGVNDSAGADFAYTMNEGVNFGNERAPNVVGPMLLLLPNIGSLDSIMAVPPFVADTPWVSNSWDFTYGTGGQPLSVGQIWAVHTREGNYAAMQITSLPNGGFGNSFTFDYKYQPNGTPDFTEGPPAFDIVNTYPMNGEMGVPVGLATIDINVSATVDEAASSISVSATGSLSGTVTIAGAGVAGSSQIVADVSGHPFAFGETVDVTLDGIIVDVNGDTLLVPYTFSFTIENQPPPSGIIYGSDTVSMNQPYFDLSEGIASADSMGADFKFTGNDGVNFGNEFTPTIPGPMLLLLPNVGSLDSIMAVPPFVADTPWVSVSWNSPYGTGGQPLSVGQIWAVHTREGNYAVMQITSLPEGMYGSSFTFDYKYQPNGTPDFTEGPPPGPFDLTLNLTGFTPHIGQELHVRVVDQWDNSDVARQQITVPDSSLSLLFSGVLKPGGLYSVDFYVDVNGNGFYDPPPTDHAWRLIVDNVAGPVVLDFQHNTNFVDIGWPVEAPMLHDLTLNVVGFDPYLNEPFHVRIVDQVDGHEVARAVFDEMLPNFTMQFTGILKDSASYNVDAYVDTDTNKVYDSAMDPSWRLVASNVLNNVILDLSPSTTQQAIAWPAPGDMLQMVDAHEGAPGDENIYIVFSDSLVNQNLMATAVGNMGGYADLAVSIQDGELVLPPPTAGGFSDGEIIALTLRGLIESETISRPDYYLQGYFVEHAGSPGGIVYGSGMVSDSLPFFDLSAGVNDSAGADFAYTMNEGVNFGNERTPNVPDPMLLLLPNIGSLDSIMAVPPFVADTPWVSNSWDFTHGTGGQPLSVGQIWAVHTREGNYAVMQITSLPNGGFGNSFTFDYKYQPNGTPNFTEGPPKYDLTLNFSGMDPHVGQDLYIRIVNEYGDEVARRVITVPQPDFPEQFFGVLEDSMSYTVDFFADFNQNGTYDPPPTDHAWRLSIPPVSGNVVLDFQHNTNFTDIMWPQQVMAYNLTANLLGIEPYVGETGFVRIVDQSDGTEVFRDFGSIDMEPTLDLGPVLLPGHSYDIDLFIDLNGNGRYDAPPTDPAWRFSTGVVSGPVTMDLQLGAAFTDIMWPNVPQRPPHVLYGAGTVDEMPDTPYGGWFDLIDGTSMGLDTTDAFIAIGSKYGPGFSRVNIAPDIGAYLYLGMGTLDTVTTVPAFDGVNYAATTYESGTPHEFQPVQPGELWAVYSRGTYAVVNILAANQDTTGSVSVHFDYLWQPDGSTNFNLPWEEPLQVKWIKPDQGAVNVPQDAAITVQFSEPIDGQSLNDPFTGEPNIRVIGSASGEMDASWWLDDGYDNEGPGSRIHLTLQTLPQTSERVRVFLRRKITSAAPVMKAARGANTTTGGKSLYRLFESSYDVSSQAVPLVVQSTYPDQNTPVDETSIYPPVRVWFSQPLDMQTVDTSSVTLFSVGAQSNVSVTFDWDEWENALVIKHDPFALDDSIIVTLSTRIASVNGSTLSEPYVFAFRTRAFEPLRIRIPDLTFQPGSSFSVPVKVKDDVSADSIMSFQFVVGYEPWHLTLDSVSIENTITKASGWTLSDSSVNVDPQSGQIVIAAASARYLQGAGPLVWLHFTHNGQNDDQAFLWVDRHGDPPVFFNEGQPEVQFKNGNISFVQTGSIYGTVSYVNSQAPVDSVLVYLFDGYGDAKLDSAVTGPDGYYEFPDLPTGDYVVAAYGFKQGGRMRAISAMDASYILQEVVGNRQFIIGVQNEAADVTFNRSVTAYDAAQILSFAVGAIDHFGGPDWLLSTVNPESRDNGQHVNLGGPSAEINISAVLLGDVTFNWGSVPAKPATGAPRIVDLRTDALPGVWQVRLEKGAPVYAADVVMTTSKPVDVAEIVPADGWQVAWRADGNTLRIAVAGSEPITNPTQLLRIRTTDGLTPTFEQVRFTLNEGAIRADVQVNRPHALAFYPAVPNPFNPSTQLRYDLPDEMAVRMTVVNALGQQVRTLVDGRQSAGTHRVTWNALDDQGRDVASGVYIVSLQAGTRIMHQRVLLVK